jgi:hypothetical protein
MNNSDKVDVVVARIVFRGDSDTPPDDLSPVERRVWFLARLDSFFSMTGLQNFFDSGLCLHYREVLACLEEIGAFEVRDWLEKLRRLYFGDMDVPVADVDRLDDIVADANEVDSFNEARVELDWNSRAARLEFKNLLYAHVLSLIEAGSLKCD